ncbi:MAG TPA: hypothetical protein VFX28_18215, partial [Methylomirabilota bacterium]|nr:hypothetical protein [Methylomirabilota bacterium]
GSFLEAAGGTLSLGGSALVAEAGEGRTAEVVTSGPLVRLDGTVVLGGQAAPLVQLRGGSLTSSAGLLDLHATTLDLGAQAVLELTGGGAATAAGPAVTLAGDTLLADALAVSDGSGRLRLSGPLLDLTDAGAQLRTLAEPGALELTLGAGVPRVRLVRSTLGLTGEGEALVVMGGPEGGVDAGVALVATGAAGAPSEIFLSGPLLRLAAVDATATDPLVQLDFTKVTNGIGSAPLVLVDPAGGDVSLHGPLLRGTTFGGLDVGAALVAFRDGRLRSATASPLVDLAGVEVTAAGALADLAGPAPFALTLGGPLLRSAGGGLALEGGLLRIAGGSFLEVPGDPGAAVLALSGGAHVLGGAKGVVVDLAGPAEAVAPEVVEGVALSLGTHRPVSGVGGTAVAAPLVELADGAVAVAGGIARLDTALYEATAPLLALRAATLVAEARGVDLAARAKLASVGPVVRLDGATLLVRNGALVAVVGGSLLRVTGDLVDLRNGSVLTLANGAVLSVTGASVTTISGALAA